MKNTKQHMLINKINLDGKYNKTWTINKGYPPNFKDLLGLIWTMVLGKNSATTRTKAVDKTVFKNKTTAAFEKPQTPVTSGSNIFAEATPNTTKAKLFPIKIDVIIVDSWL